MNASTSARSLPPVRHRPPLRGSPASRDGPGSAPLRESRASRKFSTRARATRAASIVPVFGVVLARGAARWAGALDPPAPSGDRITAEIVRHDELYYDAAPERDGRGVRPAATATGGSGSGVSRAREGRRAPTRRVGAPIADAHERRKRRDDDDDWEALPQVRHATPMQGRGGAPSTRVEAAAFVQRARRALGGEFWDGGDGPGTAARGWRRSASALSRRSTDGVRVGEHRSGGVWCSASRGDGRCGGGRDAADGGVHGAPATLGRRSERVARGARGSPARCSSRMKISPSTRPRGSGMRLFKNARNAAAGAMRRLERPAGDGTDAGPLRSWRTVTARSSASTGRRGQSFWSPSRRWDCRPRPCCA